MSASIPVAHQMPIPDELADVRAEIKRLQEREAELRSLILAHPDVRTGAAYVAQVKVTQQQRTDLKEMRAAYPEQIAEHTHPISVVAVVLMSITEDGELLNPRKLKAEAQS